MKKLLTLIAVVGLSSLAIAQAPIKPRNAWGVGFQISEWGGDFGLGYSISTPELFNVLTVDAGYHMQFRSAYRVDANAWASYGVLQLGIRSKGAQLTDWFAMYGYARASYLLYTPDTWEPGQFGAAGGFGFEFNTSPTGLSPVYYHIELGSHAGFSNVTPSITSLTGGFSSNVGLRVVF